MMAWGLDCGSWDDSVDWANLSRFDYGDIPEEAFVMTTWHDDEPLSETFWFAGHCAEHPTSDLGHTVVLHVSPMERRADLLRAFWSAQEGSR
jgi:hypothetical protein